MTAPFAFHGEPPRSRNPLIDGAMALGLRLHQRLRPEQLAPDGEWRVWLILAGRGFGKTESGASDIAMFATQRPGVRCAAVGPTSDDVRDVLFEGESGLLSKIPNELLRNASRENAYNRSLHEIWLANGSKIEGYAAEKPNRLRGPQFHRSWGDEIASWLYPDEAWANLEFATRLGDDARILATTTPKPIELVMRLVDDELGETVVTRGSTYDNRANLSPTLFRSIVRYEGTAIGRQEIFGELVDGSEGSVLNPSWWQVWPVAEPLPRFRYILHSWDTAFTEAATLSPRDRRDNKGPAESALTVWGIFEDNFRDRDPSERIVLVGKPDTPNDTIEPEPAAMLLWAESKAVGFPELLEWVRSECASKDLPPDEVLVENKASGQSLIQVLRKEGIRVKPIDPKNNTEKGRGADKVNRAHYVSHLLHAERIWTPATVKPRNAITEPERLCVDWALPVIRQCARLRPELRRSEKVDLADSTTQAWARLRDLRLLGGLLPQPRLYDEDEDDRRRPAVPHWHEEIHA